ncbi:MAG: FecR family protein [Marivibrio sp.]|uniref:FecR family protein n=1 Tax=Marivibrio sp. TaxID=2039719 RepID=UPI0032EE241D
MDFIVRPARTAAAAAGALIAVLVLIGPLQAADSGGAVDAAPARAGDVGAVDAVVATAQAARADRVRRLALNDPLFEGERLETGADARLHATMRDGSVLMLGADAALTLDRFVLDQGVAGAEMRVLRGAFRLISGEINKGLGGGLTIRTPLATIGVRGTDFWGLQREDSLLMALIDDGELSITLPSGTVVLSDPMTLMRFQRGEALPTLETLTPEGLTQAAETVALPE